MFCVGTDPPDIDAEYSLVSSEGFAHAFLICSVHANPPNSVSHLERKFSSLLQNCKL